MQTFIRVTPVWKEALTDLELRNVRRSVGVQDGSTIEFLAPERLDTTFYRRHFPGVTIRTVPNDSMRSVKAYNWLVSMPNFYETYSDFDFLAIVQTDAILIRGLDGLNLDLFDYLGAPWKCGIRYVRTRNRLYVDERCPSRLPSPKSLAIRTLGRRAWIGNGGLSVRRVPKFIALTHRLRPQIRTYLAQGLNEDVIFATAGADAGLRIPSVEYAGGVFREHLTLEQADDLGLVGVHAPVESL